MLRCEAWHLYTIHGFYELPGLAVQPKCVTGKNGKSSGEKEVQRKAITAWNNELST